MGSVVVTLFSRMKREFDESTINLKEDCFRYYDILNEFAIDSDPIYVVHICPLFYTFTSIIFTIATVLCT